VFDIEGFKNDVAQSEFIDINRNQAQRPSLFDLVKTYLVHYAYLETL
jgi:hypothetical protein